MEPGGPDQDQAYVVACIKLHMCSNFGGIWPLTRWNPEDRIRTQPVL